MQLLARMLAVQHEYGAVDDAALQALARETNTPLYRLEGLRSFYPVFRESPGAPHQVHVCRDVVCRMRGGAGYAERVRAALAGRDDVEVSEVSCLGLCDAAPACAIDEISLGAEPEHLAEYLGGARALPAEPPPAAAVWPTDPYAGVSPTYDTVRRAVRGEGPSADELVAMLKDSGLRGLGGAAFPTGMKWDFTRRAAGDPKYVICNADESEPGTFKDRVILEQQPHLVIEGMILGAWVIGANRAIIYLRHEYERARVALERAIEAAYAAGALGTAVFGSDYGLELELFVSPGGYILGEETALLEALEDKRGEPRNKPPFPTNAGLWAKPTLMNNVETFAIVPALLQWGLDWWRAQGVGDYAGLKYVSVSGDVAQPGVYCLPWGVPISEVLARAGGISGGRRLKAFSPGGASTPFLPPERLDTALDFDAVAEAGSGLGTGAMVFVAEDRDLLDVTLAQVRFFRNESCGKCVPCRVGSDKAVTQIERTRAGEPGETDAERLAALDRTLARTSICGLGQVALAPLTRALEMFPDEPSLAVLRGGER